MAAQSLEDVALLSYFNHVAKDFFSGSLIIDCSRIRLTQNTKDNPTIFETPGSIYLTPQDGGSFRITVHTTQSALEKQLDELTNSYNISPGQIIPDDHYYSLHAESVAGYIWEHPSISIRVQHFDNATVITSKFDRLELLASYKHASEYAIYYIADDLKIPCNISSMIQETSQGKEKSRSVSFDIALGNLPGLNVKYEKIKQKTDRDIFKFKAVCSDSSPFTEKHASRVLDTLRFCTATFIHPISSVIRVNDTTKIRLSKIESPNKGLISAPIHAENTNEFFELMQCFYIHSCQIELNKDSNSIIGQLANLYSLKGVRIDTIALILCVACEALANNKLFKQIGKMPENQVNELEKIISSILKSGAEEKLVSRANGMLGMMKSSRAIDKLYFLKDIGAINEGEISAWKSLRNPAAHGSLEFKPDEFQNRLNEIFKVLQLIYKLTFLIINYKGKFADYSTPGWPAGTYDASSFREQF